MPPDLQKQLEARIYFQYNFFRAMSIFYLLLTGVLLPVAGLCVLFSKKETLERERNQVRFGAFWDSIKTDKWYYRIEPLFFTLRRILIVYLSMFVSHYPGI